MIDEALAERFFLTAVQRTGQTPLPPDPNARYPWRTLFRAARQEPGLSTAMRELLRQKTVVPPGWCYALGIMELEAGRPDRAERAASALEKGHAFNPTDPTRVGHVVVGPHRANRAGAGRDVPGTR